MTPYQEVEQAKELWARTVTKAAQAKADAYVKDGMARWRFDPEVKGVVGLILEGTNRAIVVIYLNDQDLEVDEDYF